MVQMKEACLDDRLWLPWLYIPHGSDERHSHDTFCIRAIVLYIPHGSDESETLRGNIIEFLYTLYPTWFRWKLWLFVWTCHTTPSLYPTWFRWKQVKVAKLRLDFQNFISHMVQMKDTIDLTITSPPYLYIPHGSDESSARLKKGQD